MTYQAFLERKLKRVPPVGPSIDAGDVHPLLHDWQAASVQWAAKVGRCALFWDTGLGKTFAQVEWARLVADRTLIVAPLSVARQTVREARKIDVDVRYVRSGEKAHGPGVWITNYEMVDHFDLSTFGALVLDESSILKNVDGRTRTRLIERCGVVPLRLACSATPAPNDVAELTNHAEFLGVMSRAEMFAAYFVNDEKEWRLKGHAAGPMFEWMATWAQAIRLPSDVGGSDEGYVLPPLEIVPEVVDSEIESDGQLFATDLGGVGGRARVRRLTLSDRVRRAVALVSGNEQWIVWCGLNDEADAITAAVEGAVNVEGSDTPECKAEAMEAFQDGEIRVLVSKVAICGSGMNFQNCSHMAFVGLNDCYEMFYQPIKRCHRYGQSRPVWAHVVLSHLELTILENVMAKWRVDSRTRAQLVRAMAGQLQEVAA